MHHPWPTVLLAALALSIFTGALAAREISVAAVDVSASRRQNIESQIEPALEHIARFTGLNDEGSITLVLVGNSTRFAEIARADGVSMHAESVLGYAQSGLRRVVLNLAGIEERKLSPIGVLRHELTHLVLGARLRTQTPLWFEEGVCQWVEAVAMDALLHSSNPNLIEPDFADFDALNRGLRDNALAGFAYAESRRVLYQLEREYGRKAVQGLLHLLTLADANFETAFEQATGVTVAKFEQQWQEERRQGALERLFMWIGANVWVLAFLAAAVVLVVGIVLRKRRAKSQLEAWDDEDKHYPQDPSWSFTEDPGADFGRKLSFMAGDRVRDPTTVDEEDRWLAEEDRKDRPPPPDVDEDGFAGEQVNAPRR